MSVTVAISWWSSSIRFKADGPNNLPRIGLSFGFLLEDSEWEIFADRHWDESAGARRTLCEHFCWIVPYVRHLPYNVVYVVSVHPLESLSRKAHSNYVGINICSAELRKPGRRHFWRADNVAANKNGHRHVLESNCAFSACCGLWAYFISAEP